MVSCPLLLALLISSPTCSSSTVTLGGAILFLVFGCVYSYEAVYFEEVADVVLAGADALAP